MLHHPPTERPTVLAARYELGRRLGAGGMGDVYSARDTLLGRGVAIKVFRDAATEEPFDERQRSEISLLARLNHPGLVTIFDAGSGVLSDGTHHAFLVMELVPGLSLADRLVEGPLPAAQAALVGAQVAESLAYIHEAGIVHRDVKPANILLPNGDRAGATQPWTKLTDFGIARLIEDAHLTSAGLLLGTPTYLSPEQATGESPGPPTDVYALGLVLLECLTGKRAYPGTALESVAARLHHAPDVPDRFGATWVALLTAMTAREVADRPTALEAKSALRDLVAGPEPTRAGPEPTQVMPETTRVMPAPTQVMPETTRVIPAVGSPPPVGAHPTQLLEAWPDTPAVGSRRRTGPGRRAARTGIAVVVTGGLGLGLGLGLWFGLGPGAQSAVPAPAPSYPAVPGVLGEHLQQLQGSVQP